MNFSTLNIALSMALPQLHGIMNMDVTWIYPIGNKGASLTYMCIFLSCTHKSIPFYPLSINNRGEIYIFFKRGGIAS
jgi:hypothetical protein